MNKRVKTYGKRRHSDTKEGQKHEWRRPKENRVSTTSYKKIGYHLSVNLEENWEGKLFFLTKEREKT